MTNKDNKTSQKLTPDEIAARKADAVKRAVYKNVMPFLNRIKIATSDNMPHVSFITDDDCSPAELTTRMKAVLELSSQNGELKDYHNENVNNTTILLVSRCQPKETPKNEDDVVPSYVSVCIYVPSDKEVSVDTLMSETVSGFNKDVTVSGEGIEACDFSTDSNIKSADIVVTQFIGAVTKHNIYVPVDEDEDDFTTMAETAGLEW